MLNKDNTPLKMMSHGNVFLRIAILLCLLLFHSQIYAKEANNVQKLANEFCSERRTSDDRKFCLKVLTSSPKSSSAKDHSTLLKIAIDAADKNAKKTLDYMNTMFISKIINETVKPVLKDCISMYQVVINEFESIEKKLEVDSSLAKSDAQIALDEIRGCQRLVEVKKICDSSITNRNSIAEDFGQLVEDLAKLV